MLHKNTDRKLNRDIKFILHGFDCVILNETTNSSFVSTCIAIVRTTESSESVFQRHLINIASVLVFTSEHFVVHFTNQHP